MEPSSKLLTRAQFKRLQHAKQPYEAAHTPQNMSSVCTHPSQGVERIAQVVGAVFKTRIQKMRELGYRDVAFGYV